MIIPNLGISKIFNKIFKTAAVVVVLATYFVFLVRNIPREAMMRIPKKMYEAVTIGTILYAGQNEGFRAKIFITSLLKIDIPRPSQTKPKVK